MELNEKIFWQESNQCILARAYFIPCELILVIGSSRIIDVNGPGIFFAQYVSIKLQTFVAAPSLRLVQFIMK